MLSILPALVWILSPPDATSAAATAVLERVRQALGAAASTATPDRVLTGEQDLDGERSPITLQFDDDGRFALTFGDGSRRLCHDGQQLRLEVDGESTAPITGADRDHLLALSWFRSGFLFGASAPLHFDVDTALSDGEQVRLRFAFRTSSLCGTIDIATGIALPRRMSVAGAGGDSELVVLGYAQEGGRKFPRRIRRRLIGERVAVESYTALGALGIHLGNPYAAGERFDAARFDAARPAGVRAERIGGGHLLLRPIIDGARMGWFLFDSGSSSNILDSGVADRLRLTTFGDATVQGITGELDARFAYAGTLAIGACTLDRPRFTVLPLKFLRRAFGRPVEGLLGYDLLARAVVEIDPDRATIALHDPLHFTAEPGTHWQPLALTGGHATTRANLEGLDVRLVIDTGSDTAVSLRDDVPGLTALLSGQRLQRVQVSGAAQSVWTRLCTFERFTLGQASLGPAEVMIYPEEPQRIIAQYSDGLIGMPAFAGRRLLLDYPRRRFAVLDASR